MSIVKLLFRSPVAHILLCRLDRLVERGKVREIGHETIENRVGRMRWEEVSKLFLLIEAKEGW